MALEYTNRRGDRYFVVQKQTKTGKTSYSCTRKPGGIPVQKLPPEFEIYEQPDTAIVTVRKVRPTRITDSELELFRTQANRVAGPDLVIVERDGDHLVVYLCDRTPAEISEILDVMGGPFGMSSAANRQWLITGARFSPAFRATLSDDNKRLFTLERWCYRGAEEGWLPLTPERPLKKLAADYLRHLGKDSFFELL